MAIVAGALVLGAISFYALEHGFSQNDDPRSGILALMPPDASAVIFVDVAELRGAPFMAQLLVWAPKPQTDPDYAQFVRETGFDYERDLDRVAIAVEKRGQASLLFAVADGRFDRKKIADYSAKFGSSQKQYGRDVLTFAINGSPRKISLAFLSAHRVVFTNDESLTYLFGSPEKNSAAAEWHVRFDRLAGSPVFAVVQQDASSGSALAAQAPGGLQSPQLSALLDRLQWITLAGKPENENLRVVAEGESTAGATIGQLADLLDGLVLLAQAGLNDSKTRQQLDPAAREAYLQLLKSADISKIDRGETKSVRLVFEITPKFLLAAKTPAPTPPPPVAASKPQPARKTGRK